MRPLHSDGQILVVILRIRDVPTQGVGKSVVFGGGNPVGVFFAWSVLRCRGQLCDEGSGSLLVGWWRADGEGGDIVSPHYPGFHLEVWCWCLSDEGG